MARDLRPVYTAINETDAKERLVEFDAIWGEQYPAIKGSEIVLQILGHVAERSVLVERPDRRPLGAGPVVGDQQGVVELVDRVAEVDEAADVVIRVGHEPGKDLRTCGHTP